MSEEYFPLYFVKQALAMLGYKLKGEDSNYLYYTRHGNLITVLKKNELNVEHIFEIADQMNVPRDDLLCSFRMIDYMSKNDYK